MSSSKLVFVGPTLPREEVLQLVPDATLRGPAARGDIYRAVRSGFSTLCILDGYFEHRLAVWHKEVLFALAEGVRVFGAASMGALRAAELDTYGMTGVGKVYEMFRDGELEDDDEVALVHLDGEHGFFPCSEAMVNIRLSLRSAAANGVVSSETAKTLTRLGKQLFYPDRNYDDLLRLGEREALSQQQLQALRQWLSETGGIDQKRLDARELLEQLARPAPARVPPQPHVFTHTSAWEGFLAEVHAHVPQEREPATAAVTPRAVVPDPSAIGARLLQTLQRDDPELARSMLEQAVRRALALELAPAREVPADLVQSVSDDFRVARGLLEVDATEAWLDAHALDAASFSALMRDEALIQAASPRVQQHVLAQIHPALCVAGAYPGSGPATDAS